MATNHSMDQDTRGSHSKAQEAQALFSLHLNFIRECMRTNKIGSNKLPFLNF